MTGFLDGWRSVFDGAKETIPWLKNLKQNQVPTGIDFIDDAFRGGILKDDLILLGAPTGVGKTQSAVNIAKNAVLAGKRVNFFALEAQRNEIEARLMFSESENMAISSGDFMHGIDDEDTEIKALQACLKMERLKNLMVYYRKVQGFDADELTRHILSLQNQTDLIILDHFHFLDHDIAKNEILAHKEAIRKIEFISKSSGIPVILVAHLNKAHSKADTIPTHYDFYGTSDLPNICTKAFTFSKNIPEEITVSRSERFSPTVVYCSKERQDSSVTNYFAICNFDRQTGSYRSGYRLFDKFTKDELTQTDPRFPRWAKRVTQNRPYTVR